MFAVRTVGTFLEFVDPRIEEKAIAVMRRDLFYADDALDVALLHRARIPARVFDAGNTLVTDRIRDLRNRVTERLENRHELITPADSGAVEEGRSDLVKGIGASDLASGYARELYSQPEGRRRVVEAFDLVFLNGEVLKP